MQTFKTCSPIIVFLFFLNIRLLAQSSACDVTFIPHSGYTIGIPNGPDVWASDIFPNTTDISGKNILINANFIVNISCHILGCTHIQPSLTLLFKSQSLV